MGLLPKTSAVQGKINDPIINPVNKNNPIKPIYELDAQTKS